MKEILKQISDGTVEEVTTAASMSVKRQANIYSNFDIMISPHGSHNGNVIFSKKGAILVEVKTTAFVDDNNLMCQSADVTYVRGISSTVGKGHSIRDNLNVNTPVLLAQLKQVLEKVCA